jgi:4-amino-4-deoxy-L-arabinose transferase-like glycosyltransferase
MALVVICSLLHVWVTQGDTVPPAADGSGYYRTCLEWRDHIQSGRWRTLLRSLYHSDRRPPLVQAWTTALFLAVGESSIQLARLGQLPFMALLLIGTFGLGARLRDRPTGLLAATLIAGYPQVIGFSRLYWMDLPLATMVVLSIWALIATDHFSRRGPSMLFGLLLALGLLTKYTYPVFVVGPLIFVIWHARRRRPWAQVGLAAGVGLVIAGVWYVPMLSAAWLNYLYNQGIGPLPPRPWWTLTNLSAYLAYLPTTQIGLPLCLLLALSLPLLRNLERATRSMLLLWVGVPYLFFSYAVLGIEWSRFTLPYLPALALITALGLTRLREPLLRAGAVGAALVAVSQLLVLSYRSHPPEGDFAWERTAGAGLLAPQTSDAHLELVPIFGSMNSATQVALFPDHGVLASVVGTWSLEQQTRLFFSVPYAPDESRRQPPTLDRYDFVVHVISPHARSTRFALQLQRLERLWHQEQHRFAPIAERRLPNGYRLLFYRRISGPAV